MAEPPALNRRTAAGVEILEIQGVTFTGDRMIIRAASAGDFFNGPVEVHEIAFADLRAGHVNVEGSYIVNLNRRSEQEPGYAFSTSNGGDYAQRLIDALAVLQNEAARRDDGTFAETARRYRASVSPPALPEDARRYRVQAEAAIRDKNFTGAAELYANGLALAPWWPEGRYNRALILAELKEFEPAIAEMKRYLLLVPQAADARTAQDRIYEWEARTPTVRREVRPPVVR